MKAKHLGRAVTQCVEEGAAKVFKPIIGSGYIVGVVGQLQFEVLASRIERDFPALKLTATTENDGLT